MDQARLRKTPGDSKGVGSFRKTGIANETVRINPDLKKRAEKRAQDLWDFYGENGRLLLSDFKRITGGQYQSVLNTFETYGIKSPPVYDSRREKYKRKAQLLRDEVARLGQDFLTIQQAARVLKTKPSRVIGIEGRLLRAGCLLPEIVVGESKIFLSVREYEEEETGGRLFGSCNPRYYPAGLQVLDFWNGPGAGEITYLLR